MRSIPPNLTSSVKIILRETTYTVLFVFMAIKALSIFFPYTIAHTINPTTLLKGAAIGLAMMFIIANQLQIRQYASQIHHHTQRLIHLSILSAGSYIVYHTLPTYNVFIKLCVAITILITTMILMIFHKNEKAVK